MVWAYSLKHDFWLRRRMPSDQNWKTMAKMWLYGSSAESLLTVAFQWKNGSPSSGWSWNYPLSSLCESYSFGCELTPLAFFYLSSPEPHIVSKILFMRLFSSWWSTEEHSFFSHPHFPFCLGSFFFDEYDFVGIYALCCILLMSGFDCVSRSLEFYLCLHSPWAQIRNRDASIRNWRQPHGRNTSNNLGCASRTGCGSCCSFIST